MVQQARPGGTLYLVATPIGNLEDITLRALRVLQEVDLIAAEDTRTTQKLLNHYNIHTALTSYHEYTALNKDSQLLDLLAEKDIALVSEAGMPGISDPGLRLVRAAIDRGCHIVPVPGPSAVTTAVAVSGLPAAPFLYVGFLPRDPSERRRCLRALAPLPYMLVTFESPHRLRRSLVDLVDILGDRRITICRELTKIHEDIWHGTLREAAHRFERTDPRGEFTLVIEAGVEKVPTPWTAKQVRALLTERKAQGGHARSVVKEVAELAHWSKRDVYRVWIDLNNTTG